jgi:RimJ/RimL family protein N-acetyltransferase
MTLPENIRQLESVRLLLRRIEPGDVGFFTRLHADPEVVRYLGHGNPRTPQESLEFVQATLRSYEQLQLGQLAIVRKTDGELLGRCGLSDLSIERAAPRALVPSQRRRAWFWRNEIPEGTPVDHERELGYTLERSAWGNGYATEAASCVFDYVRASSKLPRIVSLIQEQNARSLRVARRLGLRQEDSLEVRGRVFARYLWPEA